METETTNTLSRLRRHMSPSQILTIGFAAVILTGALLLHLPISSTSGELTPFLDCLFTSTSAVCVTGLVVVTTVAHWTIFGQAVILALIQIGGLGIMTMITLIMMAIGRRISLRDRLVIQASYNQEGISGMVKMVRRIVLTTVVVELIGAAILAVAFYVSRPMSIGWAIWSGIFHSISAFCNAGFDIVGPTNLVPYQTDVVVNITIILLIILGGIGFTVLAELAKVARNVERRSLRTRIRHLSLHSKIALSATGMLLLSGTVLFCLLEWNNPGTLGEMSPGNKVMAAAFQSTTLRTAGYNTIDQGALTEASQFISCLLMMVGGSPAGTAGGMKTVTFGVILVSMLSVFRGRDRLEAFNRTVPLDVLQKALSVALMIVSIIFVATILLCFTERGSEFEHSFLDLLFECSSATCTVGNSVGITPYLSNIGKIIIMCCMYLGRLGPVTVVVAINDRLRRNPRATAYPEERVIIG